MDDSDRGFSGVVGLLKPWMPWRSEPAHISMDFWIPDESCRVCYECDSHFTFFNRRHHCRLCGRVFCANCTSNWLPSENDLVCNRIRVCNYCFEQRQVSKSLSKSLLRISLDFDESQQVAGEDAENDIVGECEAPSSYETESVDFANVVSLWTPPLPEDEEDEEGEEDEMEALMFEEDGDEIETLPVISSSIEDIRHSSLNQSSTKAKPIQHIRASSRFGDSTVESDSCNVDANTNVSNLTSSQTDGLRTHDEQPTLKEEFPPPPSHHQSILVSSSSRCVWKGTACERSHSLMIKYYGSFDEPLGRFLQDNLFNQNFVCHSCNMPTEAHVRCYTHQQGSLTITVKKLPGCILPGERDGEIWMWHRCLRCRRVNGYPPATRRVLMSDAAWGLSFGRFLELSFSNDAAASGVASCGHFLRRDCLQFYGFGRLIACFRYAPVYIYSVCLPPAKLDFTYKSQEWIEKAISEVVGRAECLFSEVLNALRLLEERTCGLSVTNSGIKVPGSRKHMITNLQGLLLKEKSIFEESLQNILKKEAKIGQNLIDILELNRLLRELVFQSYVWDWRLRNAAGIGVPKKFSSPELAEADTSSSVKVFDEVDIEDDREDSTSMSPTLGSGDMEDTENWLTTPFSIYYQSSNKNFSGPDLNLDILHRYNPIYISSFKDPELQSGARLLLPVGVNDTVIPVYDDEPSSLVSYALASHEYFGQLSDEPFRPNDAADSMSSTHSLDTKALHATVSFTDGEVKYNVTCYYAKNFEALRSIYCQTEVNFIRSLNHCKKWAAQGGDSNVFFAKTLDDRFIIKQVTKAKLQSFMKFAPDYFNHISKTIGSRSPTCMSKIFGIYELSSKQLKGWKETKMDVLVMDNLLFGRNITRLYDLKGSSRSRYNPDSSGSNKVLLDQNLIEAMPTSPIFVGNKAKREFERAIWNDTAFLASIDVMDYSLLMGVDEEKQELVVGIIDFMRQYTWDKQLESWVKALGRPKNASPTVISPKEYKKRFRKAMSTYFLTIPDQ